MTDVNRKQQDCSLEKDTCNGIEHDHEHQGCAEAVGCSCCNHTHDHGEHKDNEKLIEYSSMVIGAIFLAAGYFNINIFGINLSLITTLICGLPIVISAGKALFGHMRITTDLLITVAIISAVAIGEVFAAAEVAFIMCVGEFLEEYTVRKANKGLSTLISYAPKIAHLENGQDILARDLKVDDIVLVKNGERVPVDGIVLEGESFIDQSMITGESEPVFKRAEDAVFEGTINGEGGFKLKATHSGKNSTLSRMIALVEKAQREKASTVKITDKMAGYIVPISILTAIGVYFITGELIRAVTILVVFCPCSLVLSMPTAIMACIGRATKIGVLIKSGQAIENLWHAKTIVTDKTGTLTCGKMQVVRVIGDEKEVLRTASQVEALSSHPIAKAVVEYAEEKGVAFEKATDFQNKRGMGVVSGNVAVGNIKMLKAHGVEPNSEMLKSSAELERAGSQMLYVIKDNVTIGAIAVKDTVRDNAKGAVEKMRALGVKVVMATGDRKIIADNIGAELGVDKVFSQLLPEEKVEIVKELQRENNGVMMLGDGVNDAPALATADVGIAMGAIGSDVAVETADIALMNDNIDNVPRVIKLVKRTRTTVVVNVVASVLLSLFAVIFAGTGNIGPVAGALIHNLGAIVVVLNSVLLFYYRV